MADATRSKPKQQLPPLIRPVENDHSDAKVFLRQRATSFREIARTWSHLPTAERDAHEHVVKINALAPFLFGSHDPSIISEEWILRGYALDMLVSDIVLPSQVERMTRSQIDAAKLIDLACAIVVKDKTKPGAVLEAFETMHQVKGNLWVRGKALENNTFIMRWKDQLKQEAQENEMLSITDDKAFFAIVFIVRQFSEHMIMFTRNERNLKEEFQDTDASGDSTHMRNFKEEGNKHFREKVYRTAVSSYTKALSHSTYNHVLYGNRAQAYLCLGLYDQALGDSYRAIVLKHDWPKGHYRYVEALMELKRFPAAVRANLVGRDKCPADKDLLAQYEKLDEERNKMYVGTDYNHFNIVIKATKSTKAGKDNDSKASKDRKAVKNVDASQASRTNGETRKPVNDSNKAANVKDAGSRKSSTSSKGKDSGKSKGSKGDRSLSRSRTESSSGSAKVTGKKGRKKSVTIATPQPDSESDVPDLVSDDNDEEEEDDVDSLSDNDTNEETKAQVEDMIGRWMSGMKTKKETLKDLVPPAEPEKTNIDEFKLVLRQGSEALIASQKGASQAGVAVESFHQAVLMLQKHSYEEVFGKKNDVEGGLRVEEVILYCMGVAYVLKGRDSDIRKGIQLFEKIVTMKFPLAYLGLGRAFLRQNRYERAIEPAKKGLKAVEENKIHGEVRYPETQNVMEETRPGRLKIELQMLLQAAQFPPKPEAVCRYSDCSGHYKIFIYFSDPDFKGFVRVLCYAKCMIEFHHECWKKFKSSSAEKQSDKDIANGHCFTPDCRSPVWKVVFINEAREIIKEIPGNEPTNAIVDRTVKKVLKIPASSALKLKRKAERKVLRKQKKKDKEEQENVEPNVERKEVTNAEEGSTGQTSQTDGADSSLPKIEELTVLKKDEPSPSSTYMIKGKQGHKSKKMKKKEKGKVVMTLGEFTYSEGGEEVVTPEPVPVPPRSSMGLDDFGDFGLVEDRFPLLDPKRPFGVPLDLEDEIRSFEIEYSGYPTPPVESPSPVVMGPSANYQHGQPESPVGTLPESACDSQPSENADDIKETIYCVFASLLEETGPLHIYDKKILEELENFPQPAMKLIQKSGNIGRFLIQSLKFAMIDEFVCLMYDAVKARDLSDDYKEGLKFGNEPLSPPPVVKLTDQDFPAIGAVADVKPRTRQISEKSNSETHFEETNDRDVAEIKIEENPDSGLTETVSDLMAKARSLAQSISSSSPLPPPPTSAMTYGTTFGSSMPSAPPGLSPAVSTSGASVFGPPLFPMGTELSAMKWDSIQVFSGSNASQPMPQAIQNFQFVPGISSEDDNALQVNIGDQRSKSPGVIGSGTPTRNRVDLTEVSPDVVGPPVSRMFSLWQRGAGDAPSSPIGVAGQQQNNDKSNSMLDDVDDDDGPPAVSESYNIWSQDNSKPPGSQLPAFPSFSSWEPKSSLFDNPLTSGPNLIASTDNDLVNDITKSVAEELKDSPFVRYTNTDIAANIKADILNDLERGKRLQQESNTNFTTLIPNGARRSPSTREIGVNTAADNFLTAYAEIHSQFEAQSEEMARTREMLQESVKQTEIYAEEVEELKIKNVKLEEEKVLRASEHQNLKIALEVEKHRYESSAAATTQQLQAVYDKLNESESNNKELQAQIEHLIERHQKQDAKIKELKETNALLESGMQSAKEVISAQKERAKVSEVNLLKLKNDVGSEVLDRSLKEAQNHLENLQKQKTRWTDRGESIPLILTQGIDAWEKTINGIKKKMAESKTEFDDQITEVRDGSQLDSLPLLPIPRPPPPPGANIMRDILVLLHRKASPPPPGVNVTQPSGLPSVNPGVTHPPGFGLAANRPATPPTVRPPSSQPVTIPSVSNPPPGGAKLPPGLGVPAAKPLRNSSSPLSWTQIAAPSVTSVIAPSSGETWSTVTSKKGQAKAAQNKGGSFTKIMAILEQMFPNTPSDQLQGYIHEVRTSRGGSLSGLSMNEVIALTSEHIFGKQPASPPKPTLPLGGAAASGLSNFEDLSTGGASAYRSEMIEDDVDPCPICHEELTTGPVSPLECGHKFHDDCIRKWFREQSTCPTCRVHALLPDDFPRLG